MKKKNKISFSKIMEIQESILIWINTLAMLILAYFCVKSQYFGELPWLAVMAGLPWAAYGVSQACYYKKAEKENTQGGIKFESVMSTISHTVADKAKDMVQEVIANNEESGDA